MGTIASLITSLTIVYATVYTDADQRKHQSSASLAFVWGIHRRPVNSPHKWPVTRKMFPFHDVIMCTKDHETMEVNKYQFPCRISSMQSSPYLQICYKIVLCKIQEIEIWDIFHTWQSQSTQKHTLVCMRCIYVRIKEKVNPVIMELGLITVSHISVDASQIYWLCFFNMLVKLTINKASKHHTSGPVWWEPTADHCMSLRKGQ